MMHVVPPLRPSVALGVDASDPRRIVWTLEKASLTRCSATDIRTVLDTWTIKKHPWLVDWFIGDNCIIDQYNGIGIFVMAHMFVLVWPLLLVWCWCGFLLMGSFAGCCLTLEMTCLSHFDDWIKVRSRGKNKDREKARVHCNSLHISLFHIVSYCLNQPRYWRSLWSQSHWSRSLHHFAFPWVVKMWNSSWISSQRDSANVELALFAVAPWTLTILGPYPPTVIVSWQILSCCTETFLQLESSGHGQSATASEAPRISMIWSVHSSFI
jgi:hypothetical protein